jgi:ribonuclease P protein component
MPQKLFFRKEDRLTQKRIIQQLFHKGIQLSKYPFNIHILSIEKSLSGRIQVLISVPKRQFKKAADRNLIRRRIREAYRLNKNILADNELKPEMQIAIAFVYTANEIHDHDFIQFKMIESLKKIKQSFEKPIRLK